MHIAMLFPDGTVSICENAHFAVTPSRLCQSNLFSLHACTIDFETIATMLFGPHYVALVIRKGFDQTALKDKYSYILGVIILLCNNPVTPLIRAPDKWGY